MPSWGGIHKTRPGEKPPFRIQTLHLTYLKDNGEMGR